MEQPNIKSLIDRYLEGNTSLDEEAILRKFFTQSSNIPKEFTEFKPFFTFYRNAQNEKFIGTKKNSSINLIKTFLGVAALLAVIFTLQTKQLYDVGQLSNEELAITYQEFQIQMQRVSSHLNRGAQNLAYLDYWNTTTQKIITP